ADEDVVRAYRAAKERADLAKHLVARLVTERVVHLLESIDVDQNATERRALSFRTRELARDVLFAAAPIRKACQWIGHSEPFELFRRQAARRRRLRCRLDPTLHHTAKIVSERREVVEIGGIEGQRPRVEQA